MKIYSEKINAFHGMSKGYYIIIFITDQLQMIDFRNSGNTVTLFVYIKLPDKFVNREVDLHVGLSIARVT